MTEQPTNNNEAPAGRPWVLRHKLLTALGAIVALVVIAGITSSGGTKPTTNTTASDPLASSAASTAPAAAPSSAPSPSPTKPGKPSDKGWVLESFQVKDDGLGDFGGTARITNTNSTAKTATFTITLARAGTQVAALKGSAMSVAPGKTVTVDLVSQDKYSPGPTTSDFQTDVSY